MHILRCFLFKQLSPRFVYEAGIPEGGVQSTPPEKPESPAERLARQKAEHLKYLAEKREEFKARLAQEKVDASLSAGQRYVLNGDANVFNDQGVPGAVLGVIGKEKGVVELKGNAVWTIDGKEYVKVKVVNVGSLDEAGKKGFSSIKSGFMLKETLGIAIPKELPKIRTGIEAPVTEVPPVEPEAPVGEAPRDVVKEKIENDERAFDIYKKELSSLHEEAISKLGKAIDVFTAETEPVPSLDTLLQQADTFAREAQSASDTYENRYTKSVRIFANTVDVSQRERMTSELAKMYNDHEKEYSASLTLYENSKKQMVALRDALELQPSKSPPELRPAEPMAVPQTERLEPEPMPVAPVEPVEPIIMPPITQPRASETETSGGKRFESEPTPVQPAAIRTAATETSPEMVRHEMEPTPVVVPVAPAVAPTKPVLRSVEPATETIQARNGLETTVPLNVMIEKDIKDSLDMAKKPVAESVKNFNEAKKIYLAIQEAERNPGSDVAQLKQDLEKADAMFEKAKVEKAKVDDIFTTVDELIRSAAPNMDVSSLYEMKTNAEVGQSGLKVLEEGTFTLKNDAPLVIERIENARKPAPTEGVIRNVNPEEPIQASKFSTGPAYELKDVGVPDEEPAPSAEAMAGDEEIALGHAPIDELKSNEQDLKAAALAAVNAYLPSVQKRMDILKKETFGSARVEVGKDGIPNFYLTPRDNRFIKNIIVEGSFQYDGSVSYSVEVEHSKDIDLNTLNIGKKSIYDLPELFSSFAATVEGLTKDRPEKKETVSNKITYLQLQNMLQRGRNENYAEMVTYPNSSIYNAIEMGAKQNLVHSALTPGKETESLDAEMKQIARTLGLDMSQLRLSGNFDPTKHPYIRNPQIDTNGGH